VQDNSQTLNGESDGFGRIITLLSCIGIAPEAFLEFLEWALCEHLFAIFVSRPNHELKAWLEEPDGLKKFRDYIRLRTGRDWSTQDLDALYNRLQEANKKHYREPIEYGEYLKLLWNVEHECAECKRKPPEVTLHIDHIQPASKGGSSRAENLQFLCAEHNLKKADKPPEGKPWLKLD